MSRLCYEQLAAVSGFQKPHHCPRVMPEEQRQEAVWPDPQVLGRKTFVECREPLGPGDFDHAVNIARVQSPLDK